MKSTRSFFRLYSILIIALGLLVGKLYDIGINRLPLKYADIPTNTSNWINNVGKKNPDQGIVLKDRGPVQWDNDDDYGNKRFSDCKWSKEEDDNFIVYYCKDKDAIWQGRARDIMQEAEKTIPELENLMGTYVYPQDANGRKLPIYLADSPERYASTISNLMDGQSGGIQGSIGITISEIGPLGCLTKGIVLHPECFSGDYLNGYRKVLRHEMNHYIFFSLLDYGKDIEHYLWVSEGLAEYFCDRHDHFQVQGVDSIRFIEENCLLNAEFPLDKNSAYWAGESFFLYQEKTQGKNFIKNFVDSLYQYSTDSTFSIYNMDVVDVHTQWVNSLRDLSEDVEE